MNYEQSYRKLISGQSSGLGARLLKAFLAVASIGYSLVVRLRNCLYSKGWLRTHRVDAAVICIGNLTVGGTGKTPLVVWLSKQIRPDSKYAILTRGYKSTRDSKPKTQNFIDEPAMLAESCGGAEVIVNPDRVAGAARAIDKFDAKVLIMDDGFQHRRLARDLDIVAIDATRPFGYGKLLPAGLLREPAASLKRAGAVVITRCDQVSETHLKALEEKLRAINPELVIAKSIHAAVSARKTDNEEVGIGQLKDKKIFTFCGIGNPDAFLNTVKALGSEVAGSIVYDDHHHYTDACLTDIRKQAQEAGANLVLTTQKDWTKVISDLRLAIGDLESSVPFAYLAIEIRFVAGQDKLTALIQDTLAGRISI
ncbi:MAG: tetraacyldisaccharide 4'-kinase [Planctomycetota bacterium]|jgi:tetraacyldisaccharide 4'-kinase